MSETTPWWERQEAQLAAEGGAGDAACSISTSETVRREDGHDENPLSRRERRPLSITPASSDPEIRPVFLFFPQHSCKTAPDENGVMRRKCERIIKKFRMCPGRCDPPGDPRHPEPSTSFQTFGASRFVLTYATILFPTQAARRVGIHARGDG